jgi:peptidoglycan/LPS O-acetylase OafA/YrhL
MPLRSIEVINSGKRISSVDVFRSLAILSVVIYHFNEYLPFGFLGVNLFFVISGLLVGSILIRQYQKNERISFWEFFFRRGFKIWPSYYWFLLAGTLLAWLFYRNDGPEYIIGTDSQDFLRYIFFYRNYGSGPPHWTFDHIWSLCVEEHIYIFLPLLFIFIKGVWGNKLKFLVIAIIALIIAGILLKIATVYFTKSKDTYLGTHNWLDTFGWGLTLGVLTTYFEERVRRINWLPVLFIVGVLVFSATLYLHIYWKNYYFDNIIFHSLVSFSFFLMMTGLYYQDFSKWKPFRFIAYYSYNWYLWHPLFVWVISKYVGVNFTGFIIYLILSFATAFLFTILIEERFLKLREAVIRRKFKK